MKEMIMNTRRSRKRLHTMPEISLTPLIDTALVLLVIFMVATPIMHNSLAIDLPQGAMKEEKGGPSTSALIVSVDGQQRIHLNEDSFGDLAALCQELQKRAKRLQENKVYVQCDQKVPAGMLVKVIDSIKFVAGIEHVILTTERAR